MKPLHEELKESRLKKGVSLEDINKATKIRMHLLEALEEGNFTVLPLPYIRAFLREYAKEIGMDPEYVIARFEKKPSPIQDEKHGQEEKTSEAETVSQESDSAAIEKIPSGRKKPDILNDQKESPVEHPPEVDKAPVGKDESDAAEETLPDIAESAGIDTAPSEEHEPEEVTQPAQTEDALAPESSDSEPPEEQAAAKDDLQTSLFNGIQETASDSSSDNDTEEKSAETVLDESSVEQTPSLIIDDSIEESAIEKPVLPDSSTEKKRLKIDEQNTNGLFFIIFLILIIIAAGIIVLIRGG